MPCCCSSPAAFPRFLLHHGQTSPDRPKRRLGSFSQPRRRLVTPYASLHIGVQDVLEAAQNKVILTAVFAAAAGQLSKPFSSVVRGGEFDLRKAFQSGGMPSTHTASAVAVAICLGIERGFSDSIFGMTAVFAAIVMYDSQDLRAMELCSYGRVDFICSSPFYSLKGVRYQVGKHAKALNRLNDVRNQVNFYQGKKAIDSGHGISINPERATGVSVSEKASSNSAGAKQEPCVVSVLPDTSNQTNTLASSMIDSQEEVPLESLNFVPLSEAVGHTTVEVLVGALLGFVVSLTTEALLP